MTMRRSIPLVATLLAVVTLPAAVAAQGTLSVQGFGYPTGQLSTRTLGTGGALAEIDPLSATNPAAVVNLGGSALYFQAEPEYRTFQLGGATERTTIARYPLVVASIPLTQSLFAGLSLSTLLDRSFETIARGTQVLADTTVSSTNTFKSDGAIGDIRLSLGWMPRAWLHVGVAGHIISGDNRLTSTQRFDDSTRFAKVFDSTTVSYVGNAFSGGIELYTGNVGVLAASYRRGGPLSLKHAGTTLSQARVPDRVALSAAYLGIRGSSLAIRTARDTWTEMSGLGSPGLGITNGWDTSLGADVLGPRFLGRSFQLRAGGRWRTLPFSANGGNVSETSYSVGTGTLMARGRAALDLAAIRSARRSSATPARESAWTLSVGLTVRP